jgi:DNA-binding IclR family transcriptional regulator
LSATIVQTALTGRCYTTYRRTVTREEQLAGTSPQQRQKVSGAVQVVSKALDVLCCFSSDHPSWGVTELATHLGLSKSAIHRLLTTLEDYGFVQRTPSRRYRIGVRTLELGNVFRFDRKFLVRAEPLLRELALKTRSTAHLAQLEGREALELVRSSAPGALTLSPFPIFRMPLHATALGKILLANAGEDFFQRVVGLRRTLPPFTEHTTVDPDHLKAQLQKIREQGYASSEQETRKGQVCLAVPVRNREGDVVAAVSISGHVEHFHPQEYPKLLADLSSTASRIGGCL